jgi:hypothetical protein
MQRSSAFRSHSKLDTLQGLQQVARCCDLFARRCDFAKGRAAKHVLILLAPMLCVACSLTPYLQTG